MQEVQLAGALSDAQIVLSVWLQILDLEPGGHRRLRHERRPRLQADLHLVHRVADDVVAAGDWTSRLFVVALQVMCDGGHTRWSIARINSPSRRGRSLKFATAVPRSLCYGKFTEEPTVVIGPGMSTDQSPDQSAADRAPDRRDQSAGPAAHRPAVGELRRLIIC